MSAYGVGSGFNTPMQPDFVDVNNPDLANQAAKSAPPKPESNIYAILAQPEEYVPLAAKAGQKGVYQSAPDRPTLAPLFKMRYGEAARVRDDTGWNRIYEELRGRLPEGLRIRLNENQAKPVAERDPYLVAIELYLRFAADIMYTLETFTLHAAGNEAILEYHRLPEIAGRTLHSDSREILTKTREWTIGIGPNDPNFEIWTHALNQYEEVLNRLNQ